MGDDTTLQDFLEALLDDDPVQLYERAPCGYLSTTPDGTIVKANETFLRLGGFERSDLIGSIRFPQLLSRGGQVYYETHFAPLLRMHGSAREIALDLVRSDGERVPILVNAVLERTPDGDPVVVRIAVLDATHRRQYERELLAAKERAEASEAHATSLARTLQQTLIPPGVPQIPGLDVAAEYRPAGDGTEVGGDFYDIFQVADSDWVVCLGDVAGKGVDAAVVTALVRWSLRAGAVEHESPRDTLAMVNGVLCQHDTERFCTVVMVRLVFVEQTWVAIVCAGGHDLPMLRKADGTVRAFGEPGRVLGLLHDVELRDHVTVLEPGDTVLLYTDGLPEGRAGREFYGEQRILDVAARFSGGAAKLTSALLDDVLAFQGGHPRDDIAIVAITVSDA